MVDVKIRYLIKRRKGKNVFYYWYPKKIYRDAGFEIVSLGKVAEIAAGKAAALNEALDAWRKKKIIATKVEIGSVDWAIKEYRRDVRYTSLGDHTRRTYDIFIRMVSEVFGDIPIDKITRMHARAFYQKYQEKPRKAEQAVTHARIVFNFAKDMEWIATNPFTEMRVKKSKPRRQLWTQEQVNQVIDAAARLGLPSLGLAIQLSYDIGQRAGDLRRLTWSQYNGKTIIITQNKSIRSNNHGTTVEIPVMPVLAAILEKTEKASPVMLIYELTNRPYTSDQLSKKIRDVMNAAGIPKDIQMRDLRRTAVVRLAEVGCTIPEIVAITGHTIEETTKILETYFVATSGMAENAIAKIMKLKPAENG